MITVASVKESMWQVLRKCVASSVGLRIMWQVLSKCIEDYVACIKDYMASCKRVCGKC